MAPLLLSPSLNHQFLVKQNQPALAFEKSQDVYSWQRQLRHKIKRLLGIFPKQSVSLSPRTWWKQEREWGTIEKISYTSEPYSDVPSYVCLPNNASPPYRFVICLQGHNAGIHHSIAVDKNHETQSIVVGEDQAFALHCIENGMAALCIEQRAFGYRMEQHQVERCEHPCQDAAMQALMLGRTLVGERVFDVGRGIEYLRQRTDCDMKQVGIMGHSGGGTVAVFASAIMPGKIAFVIASGCICQFSQSIMSIYHCADNYIPGLLKWAEAGDIAGLIAPRPLVVVAGRDDDIFPLSGVRKAYKQIRNIYHAAKAPECRRLVIQNGGHRFFAQPAWQQMLGMLPPM